MQKFIHIIGFIVLCGILVKLSWVFIYLFGEMDAGSIVSKITGVTFAFASVYFVIKVKSNALKITMVVLDVFTILYYYLHNRLGMPIDYASVIVAAYSGLIVFFLGRIVAQHIDTQSTVDDLTKANHRHTIKNEITQCKRRIHQAKTDETLQKNEKELEVLTHLR